MKLEAVIIDADFSIKVGASAKYLYLQELLRSLADKVYIHRVVYDEIMYPISAKKQIDALMQAGIAEIVDEARLNDMERTLYNGIYHSLANVMLNPKHPRKNCGEVASLAMAKLKGIPYFVTDEKNLQPIIDRVLNNGMGDISCIRIEDVIKWIQAGKIEGFRRKDAKIIWRLAGKNTEVFDSSIWPIG